MSYDIHITRQENWFEEDNTKKISLKEWTELLSNDSEMRLDNFAEATTTNGETIRIESEGLCVWTKYSGNGLDGNFAWFNYSQGNISVKNPDKEIINKMVDLAVRLNAKVQGDDGEIYEHSLDNKISTKQISDNTDNVASKNNKPWWKFW
jgi:hypothetical protein